MRLIDADELMEKYHKTPVWDSWVEINNSPTIDAVPVVRCKDCVFAEERYSHLSCMNGISYRNSWNEPDAFCSYGERKEEKS